jgi:hypothetical protein
MGDATHPQQLADPACIFPVGLYTGIAESEASKSVDNCPPRTGFSVVSFP